MLGERRTVRDERRGAPYVTCHELLDFLYLYLEIELPEDRRCDSTATWRSANPAARS